MAFASISAGCSDTGELSLPNHETRDSLRVIGDAEKNRVIEQDLGMVRPGQKLTAHFAIENTFDYQLRIAKVDVPCSCTVVRKTSESIEPGAVLTLPVELTASGGFADIRKSVSIRFREPSAPVVHWVLVARVRPHLVAAHESVEIKHGGAGVLPRIQVASYVPGVQFALAADCSRSRFDCVVERDLKSRPSDSTQAWELRLSRREAFSSPFTSTAVHESILLKATNDEGLVESIALTLLVSPPRSIQCDKNILQFRQVLSAPAVKQSVEIELKDGIAPTELRYRLDGFSANTGDQSLWKVALDSDDRKKFVKATVEFDASSQNVSPGVYKAVLILSRQLAEPRRAYPAESLRVYLLAKVVE